MKTLLISDPVRYPRMTTEELRQAFLISEHSLAGELNLTYVDLDRAVAGIRQSDGSAHCLGKQSRVAGSLLY